MIKFNKRRLVKLKQKVHKQSSLLLALLIFLEVAYPTGAYALTGGPSQPEVQSFEPIGTSDMVDMFSGDFNYNLPLMDVEGYPINIAYHSGVNPSSLLEVKPKPAFNLPAPPMPALILTLKLLITDGPV